MPSGIRQCALCICRGSTAVRALSSRDARPWAWDRAQCLQGLSPRPGRALCLQDPAPRRRPACCALSVPSGPSGAVCEHHLLSTHRHAQVVGDAVARRSGRVCDSGESRCNCARDACTVAIATIQTHCLYETHDRVRWTSFALARDGELRSTPASAPTPVAAVGSTTCMNRQSAALSRYAWYGHSQCLTRAHIISQTWLL